MPYDKKAYQKRKKREYMKAYNLRRKKRLYMVKYNAWKRAQKKLFTKEQMTPEETLALRTFKRTRFPKSSHGPKPILLGKVNEHCGCGDHACGKDHELPGTEQKLDGAPRTPSLSTLVMGVTMMRMIETAVAQYMEQKELKAAIVPSKKLNMADYLRQNEKGRKLDKRRISPETEYMNKAERKALYQRRYYAKKQGKPVPTI